MHVVRKIKRKVIDRATAVPMKFYETGPVPTAP